MDNDTNSNPSPAYQPNPGAQGAQGDNGAYSQSPMPLPPQQPPAPASQPPAYGVPPSMPPQPANVPAQQPQPVASAQGGGPQPAQRPPLRIDHDLLAQLGLATLPEEEKKALEKHIYETLEMNVGMRLADQMTNEQLDEFETYFNARDDAGAFRWLETNFPNYKDIVAEEFEKLKTEVAQNAPHILAASQQQASQPAGPSQVAADQQQAPSGQPYPDSGSYPSPAPPPQPGQQPPSPGPNPNDQPPTPNDAY